MKRIFLFAMFFLVFTSFMSLHAQWAIIYGGSGSDYPRCVQQTSDGGYVIAGDTSSFGAGDRNCWILKVSSIGDIEWQKIYGGSDYDSARFIQQTTDGGYIVAAYTSSFGAGENDFWVLKLDATGTIEWQKTYGGQNGDGANCIYQTTDGGYIVAGGTYSFGSGSDDAWILKLSSTGTIEWQKTYGGSEVDSAGSIRQTNDGGYIVGGCTESFGVGYYDVWVVKLSSTGTIEWQKTYGGYMNDGDLSYKGHIEPATDGGYVVTTFTWSFTSGYSDVWVFKISSTGSIEWQNSYGSWSDYDTPYLVRQTADGGYIFAGFTYSFGAGENDVWVVKLSSTGTMEWQKTYGGIDYDFGRFIQQTADGGYIVVAGTGSFGAGDMDILLLKLYPDGEIVSSCELTGVSTASTTPSNAYVQDSSASSGNSYIVPSNTSTIPLDTDASVNVLCEALKYTLAISTATGGTTDPAPGSHTYYSNTQVQIEAIPETGYKFSGWTGDVPSGHENDNPVAITMDSDKTITANFIRQYTLTITAGAGGTTDPSPGSYTYDSGTEVTIRAIPETGYKFSGWTGDVPSGNENDNPVTVTIDEDKSITANFIQQCTLIINAGPGGTTNPSPGSYDYDYGTQVSVTATASSGYDFSGWSGAASGTATTITINMDSNKSITANFTATPPEEAGGGDGGGKKGGCFIATAAYGSPLHPHLDILWEFRDTFLMPNKPGRALIYLYYKYSPYLAELIAKHKVLKVTVRINLLPLVAFSYLMIYFGPVITAIVLSFILAFPAFLTLFIRRKFRRLQAKNPKALASRFWKR